MEDMKPAAVVFPAITARLHRVELDLLVRAGGTAIDRDEPLHGPLARILVGWRSARTVLAGRVGRLSMDRD